MARIAPGVEETKLLWVVAEPWILILLNVGVELRVMLTGLPGVLLSAPAVVKVPLRATIPRAVPPVIFIALYPIRLPPAKVLVVTEVLVILMVEPDELKIRPVVVLNVQIVPVPLKLIVELVIVIVRVLALAELKKSILMVWALHSRSPLVRVRVLPEARVRVSCNVQTPLTPLNVRAGIVLPPVVNVLPDVVEVKVSAPVPL